MQIGHWITAATQLELDAVWKAVYPTQSMTGHLLRGLQSTAFHFSQLDVWCMDSKGPWFSVTGAGLPQSLMRGIVGVERLKPAAIWQFGLAGAFVRSGLNQGETVWVAEECLGDLGLEVPQEDSNRPATFRPLNGESWADPFACGPWTLNNPMRDFALTSLSWKAVRGMTVNQVTGTDATGHLRGTMWQTDIETMEGAAMVLVGKHFNLPVYQIRTISNEASHRNISPQSIALALERLRIAAEDICYGLQGGTPS